MRRLEEGRAPGVREPTSATLRVARRDRHSLTNYPCRLRDGRIGRVAVVLRDGDWTLLCRVAWHLDGGHRHSTVRGDALSAPLAALGGVGSTWRNL